MLAPTKWYIFLEPVKKVVTSASGIILEEDKGEFDPHIYTIHSIGGTLEGMEVWSKVIANDASGTNVFVQGQSIKVVTPDLILGFIS